MSGITFLVIAVAVTAVMLGRLWEKAARARRDLADALSKAAQLRRSIPALITQAALVFILLAAFVTAAAAATRLPPC